MSLYKLGSWEHTVSKMGYTTYLESPAKRLFQYKSSKLANGSETFYLPIPWSIYTVKTCWSSFGITRVVYGLNWALTDPRRAGGAAKIYNPLLPNISPGAGTIAIVCMGNVNQLGSDIEVISRFWESYFTQELTYLYANPAWLDLTTKAPLNTKIPPRENPGWLTTGGWRAYKHWESLSPAQLRQLKWGNTTCKSLEDYLTRVGNLHGAKTMVPVRKFSFA